MVSHGCPPPRGRSLTCYSPVRHSPGRPKPPLLVRLACVKHAASVHPEPGSNSPNTPPKHTPTRGVLGVFGGALRMQVEREGEASADPESGERVSNT